MEAIDLKKLRKNLFGLPTNKVSRSLFGETDHEEVKKDLEREYNQLLQEKSKLWNFDFDKYEPRDETPQKQQHENENGFNLKWIPYRSSRVEHSIEKNKSLITSTSQDFTTVQYCPRIAAATRHESRTTTTTQQTPFKQPTTTRSPTSLAKPLPKKIETEGNTTSSSSSSVPALTHSNHMKNLGLITSADEDENVIQIINESPIRNIIINPAKDNCCSSQQQQQSKAKLDITKTLSRKRKRGSQPTIDGMFCFVFSFSSLAR